MGYTRKSTVKDTAVDVFLLRTQEVDMAVSERVWRLQGRERRNIISVETYRSELYPALGRRVRLAVIQALLDHEEVASGAHHGVF